MYDTSLNETIYSSGFLIGVDEPSTSPLRNITLLALLGETGCLTNNDGTSIPQHEINEIKNLSVEWKYDKEGDMYVREIYNHDTGEVYWNYDSIGNMDWTDNDDKLVGSLIMWGNLESTII